MSSAAHSPEAVQSPEMAALQIERQLAHRPARKTRGVFVSFATMVVVGFGLAGWYVSSRIIAAETQPAASVRQAVSQPAPAATSVAAPVPPTSPALQEAPQVLLPLVFEYYLQIAALGTPEDLKYLQQLQSKGYRAQLEPAAVGHPEARILIGPFSDESSMRKARTQLVASGILAIELAR